MTPCRCGTREYPHLEAGCVLHGHLARGVVPDALAAYAEARISYDQRQAAAELVTCPCCAKSFYMTRPAPVCAACREKGAV